MANNVTTFTWHFHPHPVLRGNGKVAGYQAAIKEATHGFLQVLDPQTYGEQKDAVLTAHALYPNGVFERAAFKTMRMETFEASIEAECDEIEAKTSAKAAK